MLVEVAAEVVDKDVHHLTVLHICMRTIFMTFIIVSIERNQMEVNYCLVFLVVS